MVVYNLKGITVVPTAKDFVDIILSKTQRKTATVVHKGYQISRIRSFYMKKVKYSAQCFHDKLSQILTDFPVLDEIHPFYADLMNVLYDRDHYKLALGQLNTARALIDNLAKDYLRLLKYGDSLYRCKQLKRAALGRMCTIMKKQGPNLAYLEQVRQHLARLPSIDPNSRTIIICGYPNVGKSSFMNRVTRADVDVQPYAFTTKSLFVGHTDYRYLRWQVIDTPGILDHPLEERNTIEMQSITALAHLRAAILFIIDISENCGYSIKQQVDLFNSIKPLFVNKPLIVALNKIDVIPYESIPEQSRQLLEDLEKDNNVQLVKMTTLEGDGVSEVKEKTCDKLLEYRVESKLASKNVLGSMNRLHQAVPVPRDSLERPPFIPPSVIEKKQKQAKEKEEAEENLPDVPGIIFSTHKAHQEPEDFDPTIFGPDFRKDYLLANDEWKFDVIPEIIDGKNIADYIDPEIMERLEELEREEEEQEQQYEAEAKHEAEQFEELNEEEEEQLYTITEKQKLKRIEHSNVKNWHKNKPFIPRKDQQVSSAEFKEHFEAMGQDPSRALKRIRETSRSRSQSRSRSMKRQRSDGENRSISRSKTPGDGFKTVQDKLKVNAVIRKQRKVLFKKGQKGEGDRTIVNLKPKHLFSGKRTNGTHDYR